MLFVGTIVSVVLAVPFAIFLRRKSDKAERLKPNQTFQFSPLVLIAAFALLLPAIVYASIKVPLAVLALVTATGGFFVVKKFLQGKRWAGVMYSGIILYLDMGLIGLFIEGFQ